MSNDSEKPNLEKDHKEFLKTKEQQINNEIERLKNLKFVTGIVLLLVLITNTGL